MRLSQCQSTSIRIKQETKKRYTLKIVLIKFPVWSTKFWVLCGNWIFVCHWLIPDELAPNVGHPQPLKVHSHQPCLLCFNRTLVCLSRESVTFGELWMHNRTLTQTKNTNSSPPENLGFGSVDVNSSSVWMHMWLTSLKAGSKLHGILGKYN